MKSSMGRIVAGVSTALVVVWSHAALAQSEVVTLKNEDPAASAAAWTALDFASARPIEMVASLAEAREVAAPAESTGKKVGRPGSMPTAKVAADLDAQLFDESFGSAAEQTALPVDRGTSGANYTLSSMIPDSQANALTYPHRTTGKLYFTTPGGGRSYCTASVINRRIVATAGHCVSNGRGTFYSNWQFIPATWNNSQPLQVWNWRFVVTTTTWHNGGGGVPNAADYAMIEVEDRPFSGVTWRIGAVTGWLGWRTGSCQNNHTHKLGYPGNVFGGLRLSLASSQTWRNVAPFNCEYGTSQTFGASGGPWVQNFSLPNNPIPQNNPGWLQLVTVASYTYGQTFGVLGGSELDDRWVAVWNVVCGHRAGNCS